MSKVMQEPPEPHDRVVIFGFSPAPRAMTWLVLLTTLSRELDLQSGQFISTDSSDFRKIFSKTLPHALHRNSKIGISFSSVQAIVSHVNRYSEIGMSSLLHNWGGKESAFRRQEPERRTINE
jgi:hypothetical protein